MKKPNYKLGKIKKSAFFTKQNFLKIILVD